MNPGRTSPTSGIVSGLHGLMVELLAGLFRFGTPVLVILCATRLVAWWIVLVPVFPVWWSFVTTAHEARKRAHIIRRPKRRVSLDEAASEVRFGSANAALDAAALDRAAALSALTEARARGDGEAQKRDMAG